MISAVVPPQPQLLPPEPPSQAAVVRSRAAAGYFRDLALWLNQPLAPHGIFVQVQADRPGCLRLVVEFQRPPIKDHLLRFLCHRVWLLNSELIEGILVVARPLGHRRVLWQQRIKIKTPALKRRQAALAAQARHQAQKRPRPSLPPSLIKAPSLVQRLSRQRLQALRAFVLSGSAVAAFVMGCFLEAMLSGPVPVLPQFGAQAEVNPAPGALPGLGVAAPEISPLHGDGQPAADIAITPATPVVDRPTVVDAALEPVGVISYDKATPVPSNDVTLVFGGDVSLEDIGPDSLTASGGFFADVPEYGQADVALVNLATPLANAATNLQEVLHHQTRTEAANLLVNSGVDIVNLTHSRLMDYGAAGLDETLTTLDSKGLYRIGAGRNALEARRPEVLDVKGKRIAYLSYAMGGNNAAHDDAVLKERAGIKDKAVAKEVENFKTATAFKDRAGFNAQGMPEIVADIQALRQEVDWIVVNFRWVDQLSEQPNFMQTNLAKLAIDQGADVVVGYHPTVIQGGEIYKGRPIAYSLGDFVFRPEDPIESQDSALLKIDLKDEQLRVELVPVRVRDSHPETLKGEASQAVLQRIEQASSQFDIPLKSPMVLDLKTPELTPETVSDPSSPFVSPEVTDVVPVEPAPHQPERPEDPPQINPTRANNGEEKTPSPEESTPTPQGGGPEALPEIEVQFDDDLPEWGTKVSPEQREFQPLPPQRGGGDSDSGMRSESVSGSFANRLRSHSKDPQTPSHLWGEPVAVNAIAPTPRSAEAPDVPGWDEAVPQVPNNALVE